MKSYFNTTDKINNMITLPEALFCGEYALLETEAKVLYGYLQSRQNTEMADEWGHLYVTEPITAIQEKFGWGNNKVIRLLRSLETAGLILRRRSGRGQTARTYVLKCENDISEDVSEGVQKKA